MINDAGEGDIITLSEPCDSPRVPEIRVGLRTWMAFDLDCAINNYAPRVTNDPQN